MQKYRILIFLTICAVFIISGCRNTGTGNDNKYPDSTEFEEDDDDDETGTDSHELSLYTIDYETYECTPTVSVISEKSEINAKLIINEVIANFTENVIIKDIVENSDNIIVYFSDDAAPVKNVSEKWSMQCWTVLHTAFWITLIIVMKYISEVMMRYTKANIYI